MSTYLFRYLAVALLTLAASGCCCFDRAYRPSQCCDSFPATGGCGIDCVGCSICQQTRQQLTTCSGCGDMYWGEWISDPPDACDPCDGCGNWTGGGSWFGGGCCRPRLFSLLTCSVPDLWGTRFGNNCCDQGGGCSSCGSGGPGPWDGMEYHESLSPPTVPGSQRQPTPAPERAPSEVAPESLQAPQPMPSSQTMHGRSRHPSARPLPIQPTRGKRPATPRTATSQTRSRTL